jgi:hypothetical protein
LNNNGIYGTAAYTNISVDNNNKTVTGAISWNLVGWMAFI